MSKCGQRVGQVILFIVNLMKEKFTSQLRPATRIKVYHKIFPLKMRPPGQETNSRVMSHFVKATCRGTMIMITFVSHLSSGGENEEGGVIKLKQD